ncbi:adhesion G protein-coupled receptor L2-like [Saccoglossus kowalevskii]|uniref:Uncharacterized protein LOC100366301 n=1 Tax=Saccoglossus kowalevskii TaxID=10224 RepID=A0ABM0M6K1_SACKO|nr:PREDICTED: uncharacterized protein LOC100366301 [Saccoglossus kowalevskii]
MNAVVFILLVVVPALYADHEIQSSHYLGRFREQSPLNALPNMLGGLIPGGDPSICEERASGKDVYGLTIDSDYCFSGDNAADTYDINGYSNSVCSGRARDVYANVKVSTTCQREMFELSCDNGGQIQIIDGFYGRRGDDICEDDPESTDYCHFDVTNILKKLCDGLTYCTKNTVKKIFGDPCDQAPKHLVIQYYCK